MATLVDEEIKALLDAAANDEGRAYIYGVGVRLISYGKPMYVTWPELAVPAPEEHWYRWVDTGVFS